MCANVSSASAVIERTRGQLGLTHIYSVDFEKMFITTHRDCLKNLNAEMRDPAKNGGKVSNKERSVKVHCTSVIDTDATKEIIYEGLHVFGCCKTIC